MPGADPIYIVYDRADHPVLIQDGNLRTKNEWLFTKYDALDREIVTGLLTSDYSHNDFIEICRDTLVVEEFAFNYEMPIIGYTNRIKLGNNIRVLTINYYDNHQFRNLNDYQNIFLSTGPVSNNKEIYQNCQGLITATYIGQTDNMNRYEISSFYYDTQGRIVEKLVEVNGFGPHNHIYIEYDFAGNPINIKKEHVALNYEGKQTQIYTYQYDHAGRITSESLKFNTLKEKKIHEYLYNDLGQVSQKFLHDRSDTITYTYNLRGWPISITNRAFSQQLYYEEALVPQSTRYFNGNISAVKYSQGGREYSFHMTYDALDRIISSQSFLNGKMANDLEEFNFDKMGNIKNIVRKKNNIYTHQLAFEHKGNQLTDAIDLTDTDIPLLEINTENPDEPSNYSAIPDDSQEIISGKKIRDPVFGENLLSSTSNNDIPYAYDKNGNMSRNTGKNIENIIYNHLNLPQSVEFGNNDQIANHYMADGRRVISTYTSEAKIDDSGILQPQTITTDCLWGEYIYRNYKISMIKIPGGYIQVDNTKSDPEQKYTFVRYIYDHLGNVRITADNSGILQSTEYYPSGYFFNRTGTGSQPYLLGEKEYINMFGLNQYDFGARIFDPYFLRWSTPDPLQEKYYSISPYAYCNNNPILYTDPDGRDWYKDQDSTIQYSPEINRNSRLADGQRYLGQTYTESVNGKSIVDYRKDGSILFYREREAYRRMINQTVKTGNESMAILMSDKVLVLPDYQNTPNEVNLKSYHYSAKGGNIIDAGKNTWPIIATAHTHPNGTPPSNEDKHFSINITPYKPVYVLQMKGNNSISAVTGRPGIENGTLTENITQTFPEFHLNNLTKGKCSLIEFTKHNNFKNRVINAKRL